MLAAAGLIAVALGAVFAVVAYGENDRIPRRVRVGTIGVGGLDATEAARLIRREAARLNSTPVTIVLPDGRLHLTPAQLGATPLVDVAIEQARTARGSFGRVLAAIGLGTERNVDIALRADARVVESIVSSFAASYDRVPRDAEVRRSGSRLELVPAAPGRRLDRALLRKRLTVASGTVVVPFRAVRPALRTPAAQQALELGRRLAARPLVVEQGGARAVVQPSVVGRALRFTPGGSLLAVALDPAVIARPLEAALGRLERTPVDAAFRVVGDRVVVVPARAGRRLDIAGIAAAAVQRPGRSVTVRFVPVRPLLTTAKARAMRIVEPVAEFTTSFACCPPRVTNIRRGAEILDGQIIPPGGLFSLNAALGERTRERGFLPAPMILAGRLVDAVGGGVSQIAATLYNAGFFAGLDLVEHTPHEFFISRYPMGREATISWGSPDLVIRNSWPAGVLIEARADTQSITIRLFSSTLGRRVEAETGHPYARSKARTRVVMVATLPPGDEQVSQVGGVDGFAVDYTRRIYRDGRLVADEKFTTRYHPEDTFVEVGRATAPAALPEAALTLLAAALGGGGRDR